MSKRSIIILCVVISIIILGIFVYYIGKAYTNNEVKLDPSSEIVNVNDIKNKVVNSIETSTKENVTVSPSAKIEMTQYYEECGHVVKDEYKVPTAVVNMSESKVKEYYSGWEVKLFTENQIKIYKNNDGICNEHYILKDIGGYVNVFVLGKSGDEVLFRATDILTRYLSDADRESLKNGIKVVGKDDLEAMLEDFE